MFCISEGGIVSKKEFDRCSGDFLKRLRMQASQFVYKGSLKVGYSFILQFESKDSTKGFNLVVTQSNLDSFSSLIGWTINDFCGTNVYFRRALSRFLQFRSIPDDNIRDTTNTSSRCDKEGVDNHG